MIKEQTIEEFTDALSSREPVPGGGGASALAGAYGAALGLMVGNLTVGKKKYASVEDDVKAAMERLEEIRADMEQLADEDAKVFAPLSEAYKLPKETDEEKAYKAQVMEPLLMDATIVPLKVMEGAIELIDILSELEKKGSTMAISDVGVAVQFARCALTGGVMNVYINSSSMQDRQAAQQIDQWAGQLIEDGCKKADEVYDAVLKRLY